VTVIEIPVQHNCWYKGLSPETIRTQLLVSSL